MTNMLLLMLKVSPIDSLTFKQSFQCINNSGNITRYFFLLLRKSFALTFPPESIQRIDKKIYTLPGGVTYLLIVPASMNKRAWKVLGTLLSLTNYQIK
ncbi:unnamed protein product [Allacma fusca]|uniref:Uncharacterized protein n=1 Tax=Allacma fusca TaxID=39272 RepID=A0A8J2M4A6_9HEXA|nr:unnamed protein product [Allacma fusca]